MAESDRKLKLYRDRIDRIDADILRLMHDRLTIARSIAGVKETLNEPAYYRPEREAQILARLHELNHELENGENSGLLDDQSLTSLFREILSITRSMEAALSVSVLGPPGTYTEAAARHHFGSTIGVVDFPTIAEVFKATEAGQTDFAVVPIENSTEGGVSGTLDRLVTTPLTICSEINLRILHNLLGKGTSSDPVTKVYAHVQSLGQCQRWLHRHCPHAELVPVSSNAEAARIASEGDGVAAIASSTAAERYQLNTLAANIADEPANTTRFLVLSNRVTPPSGNDKTSLLLSCRSRPGALLHLLSPLLDEQIDMTKIESRPSRVKLWDYLFFIDIVGHQDEEHVSRALERLKEEAGLFKNLGSYSVSQ